MNINICSSAIPGIVFAAVLSALPASAQETEYTDLYYNQDLDESGWTENRYMQNAAAWNVGSPDGPVFDGSVNSASNNLFIITSSPTTGDRQTLFGYNVSNWSIHNLTINMEMKTHYDMLELVPNQHLSIGGDFDVTIKNCAGWWAPGHRVKLDSGTSITVEGDMRVENSMTAAESDAGSYGQSGVDFCLSTAGSDWNSSFTVKGNLVFKSADTHTWSSDSIVFSTSAASITIGGYVDMTQTRAGTRTWDLFDAAAWDSCASDIKIGGLEGGGALRITSAHNATVNLTFANSSAHSYSGTFASRADSANKLNVTMDASDAQNGRQTLIIREGGAVEGDAALNAAGLNTVTVLNGTLNLGAYNGLVNGELYLGGAGGRLEISSASGEGGVGALAFENATFESGAIVFTIEEAGADKLAISGELTKFGSAKIGVEFDADPYDINEWILASGGESIEYELISFGSTNAKDGDFAAQSLGGGVFANLFIRDNALYVEFSTVPEPAMFAALFGAVALMFAARRGRK